MLFHAVVFRAIACFEHSNFLTVNDRDPAPDNSMPDALSLRMADDDASAHPSRGGPVAPTRNPTTSFLTATTLIYAIGAGITAAAGTRLALQLILVKGFKFYSFQLQDMDALYCYFLSLPPCVRIG